MLLTRAGWGAFSVLIVTVIVYAATIVLPGDAAQAILGQQAANPERLAILREQLGLDKSPWEGFWDWFTGILHGDFGTSLTTGLPVTELLGPKILNSACLVLVAAVVSTIIGVTLGAVTASRRDGVLDHATSIVALVASALPEFIVGVFVVLFLAVNLHWFPAISVLPPGQHIWDEPSKLVLPVLTLTIVVVPYILRMCRGSVTEALDSDYAEVARLKGVNPRRLLYRHALPNALAPTVQVVGLSLIYLAGGIVLVETVFQFPGIGLALVDAITARDVPVIQAIVILLSTCYVVLNILADLAVLLVTPRRRLPR
ncbi:MAG TPA: ABC transporter permease [Nocardioides sp.]|nr:ABC transporter permease [Nocardioides sp.]HRI97827.1 ABC transporter permease [Nocardioides sp.]HRK47522.1 ABC transporter permease [Nocardioides sp.]